MWLAWKISRDAALLIGAWFFLKKAKETEPQLQIFITEELHQWRKYSQPNLSKFPALRYKKAKQEQKKIWQKIFLEGLIGKSMVEIYKINTANKESWKSQVKLGPNRLFKKVGGSWGTPGTNAMRNFINLTWYKRCKVLKSTHQTNTTHSWICWTGTI